MTTATTKGAIDPYADPGTASRTAVKALIMLHITFIMGTLCLQGFNPAAHHVHHGHVVPAGVQPLLRADRSRRGRRRPGVVDHSHPEHRARHRLVHLRVAQRFRLTAPHGRVRRAHAVRGLRLRLRGLVLHQRWPMGRHHRPHAADDRRPSGRLGVPRHGHQVPRHAPQGDLLRPVHRRIPALRGHRRVRRRPAQLGTVACGSSSSPACCRRSVARWPARCTSSWPPSTSPRTSR